MKIVFATGNAGKLREVKELLKDLDMEIITMREAGFMGDIVENGRSFSENAEIKCRAVGPVKDGIVIGEDSGLEIDALLGLPGIYSARFLGDESYEVVNDFLCETLAKVSPSMRTARFRACVCALFPDGTCAHAEGTIEGVIASHPAGENGFGYDPIFYVPSLGKTTAEVPMEEKSAISHRGKAMRQIALPIRKWMEEHEDTCVK